MQININEILDLLPHRYPFLLVDRIVDIVDTPERKEVTGYKNVTFNEPFFQGHFPGRPIMPGVLQIEALAQAAGVLAVESLGLAGSGKLVYFMAIEEAKFRSPVEPGDVLELHVEIIRGRGKVWKFNGVGKVGDRICAEAVYTAMIMEPEAAAKARP